MQKFLQDIHIGHNIKRLRQSKGLSQDDMVARLQLRGRNISRATYAHIEQGIRNIYVSDLILIRQILNVSYEDFFQGLESGDG